MATKENENLSHEHDQPHYQGANGTSNDLGRQLSVTLTQAQFEELYLQPGAKSRQSMGLVKTFGNPTALGIVSFLLTLTPTSCCLMGFRGSTSSSLLGLIGPYYFMGGLALYVAGLLEFVIGNTFPALVFSSFGSFWLSLAAYVDPGFQVQATLLLATGGSPAIYYNPWGFYLIFWAIYVFFLTFAALRTNGVLVWILFFVAMTFTLLGAAYLQYGSGADASAANLVIGSGAMGFTACMGGFYILFHLCLASTDFPFNLPLFDLSHLFGKKA